jgi:geranylgeranyl diphosphate synthase, type II
MTSPVMGSDLDQLLSGDRQLVDDHLQQLLQNETGIPERLCDAMAHSLLGGGKRLRPVLLLWACRALADDVDAALMLDAACALEMIHTYSLIHDDLPAMDDDVLRRGRPTCHVAFDEATAILAGDGLQALAFAILARNPNVGAELVGVLAAAAGPAGMVGGQQRDLDAEDQKPTEQSIHSIHLDKTARLIAAPLVMGGILSAAAPSTIASLEQAGLQLGLAFQAADDCLDVESDTATLGKTAGKDVEANKSTWVQLEGLEQAHARTRLYGQKGHHLLSETLLAGPWKENLLNLADRLWNRSS